MAKIDSTGGKGSCWPWSGFINPGGYGQVTYQGRVKRVHRVIYESMVGPIPEGMTIDHLCFNTLCQNPWHMSLKTRSANAARKKVTTTNICRRGHDLTVTGRITGNGSKTCTECLKITSAAHYEKLKRGEHAPGRQTDCKRGHGADTMKQYADGRWYCAECKRITNTKPKVPPRTACREGHAYATHGKRERDGHWRCVTCHNARRRERAAERRSARSS